MKIVGKSGRNILVIAPHPYYMERGTPIACRLLVKTLCEAGNKVDLLVYNEGEDPKIAGCNIHRLPNLLFLKNVPIGFSVKKLICDFFLIFEMLRLAKKNRYDVIHAGEEAVFLAIAMKSVFGDCPVVYDMDSSMADQILEKYPKAAPIGWFLNEMEKIAFRCAEFILPVCDALAEKIRLVDEKRPIEVLEDVFFEPEQDESTEVEPLRADSGETQTLMLYVGNLEGYQGIDLLIEGIEVLVSKFDEKNFTAKLIGGNEADIQHYRQVIRDKSLTPYITLLGARPLSQLPQLLEQADILLSPRTKGGNTPMKLYSYLASGVPVLATNIRSHTQAIDQNSSCLVDLSSESMAAGMFRLINDPDYRRTIGTAGKELAYSRFSYTTYCGKLLKAYSIVNFASKKERLV